MKKLVFLPAGLLLAFSGVKAAEVPDSEHVSKLLSEAKTLAFQVKEDAASMEAFTRMDLSWESHAIAITQIREHVNALGRQADKLREARPEASPWQRKAIDGIQPFIDELGGYTAAVIEHLNAQPRRLFTPEYKDFLEANADYSGDLAKMIADYVDYGKTKDRLQDLSEKLEIHR